MECEHQGLDGSSGLAKIEVSMLAHASPVRVHLDSPKNSPSAQPVNGGVLVQGWIHPDKAGNATLLLSRKGDIQRLPLNQRRGDVMRALAAPATTTVSCGFSHLIEAVDGPFQLGFEIDGRAHWVWQLVLTTARKVLAGDDGWLFLDNDSNASVDQFRGHRLLSEEELHGWDQYYRHLRSLIVGFPSTRFAFLLCPGKEYVIPSRYPVERGATTPVDQFVARFGGDNAFLFPLEALSSDAELCFWKGDTHWTDFGAAVGSAEVLAHFGVNVDDMLGNLEFVCQSRAGDLGGKLYPPPMHWVFTVPEAAAHRRLVYDNGVPNHGRIRSYWNPSIQDRTCCLVFGDSFATNMVPWLAECFTEVVLVHTAGAIDEEIVAMVEPTHVLAQSNTRFIVVPPAQPYSFWRMLDAKANRGGLKPLISDGSADDARRATKLESAFSAFRSSPVRPTLLRP